MVTFNPPACSCWKWMRKHGITAISEGHPDPKCYYNAKKVIRVDERPEERDG